MKVLSGLRPGQARTGDLAATLLAIVLALMAIGTVMVYSTTVVPGDKLADPTFFFRREVLWMMLAMIGLTVASQTDYRSIVRYRWHLQAIVFVALVGVLFARGIHGKTDGSGAHRWFEFGAIHFQPSELAKVSVLLVVCGHCARAGSLATFRRALPVFATIGASALLIAVEPDFGTCAFTAALAALVLLVAGVRLHHVALIGIPAVLLVGAYAATHFEHVRTRMEVFAHPDADPTGKGFQINQALIALGSGGPLGLGLGESRQKLFFLPDDHTDFILAIVGEELGLVGTLAVAALFAGFIVYGMRIAMRARDRLGFLLAFGVTSMVGLQGVMNIAVVTASMPTKGIALPFVSYGGSSLLIAASAVGVLLNVAKQAAESAPEADPRAAREREIIDEPLERAELST